MPELVSIIMPAYNVQSFIEESIQSVLHQTYLNWELLIVDDCSSDDTLKIISSFLSDDRIILIKNESNSGGAYSRNKALKAAKGRFVAFLDSDDLWKPNKLRCHIEFMTNNNIGFSYSNYQQFYNDKKSSLIIAPSKVNYKQMLKSNFIGCLTVVYDTSFFGKFYFPETKKRHDFALWLNMLKKFDCAYNVGEALANYRVHNASLSSNKKDAFQSYFYILYNIEGLSFFNSFLNTTLFTTLSLLKKKNSTLYILSVKFFISHLKFSK